MNELIPSFLSFVQVYSPCFRKEVFITFREMLCGWLICSGRRTITRVWESTGLSGVYNHSSAFRLFSNAKWCWDNLCCILIKQVVAHFVHEKQLYVVVDDTLCHKRGAKVAFGGMFRDAVLSTEKCKVFCFGHNWVLLGIVVRLSLRSDRYFCLPVLWRLYKKKGTQKKNLHRTKNQLAAEMVTILANILPEHKIILLGDDAYISKAVIRNIPNNVKVVGPIDWVATIYKLPKQDEKPRKGPKHTYGERLPELKDILRDDKRWPRKTMTISFGNRKKKLEIKLLDKVLWYRTAGTIQFRIVFIHDPSGQWRDEVLCCSDSSLNEKDIILSYCRRWSVEVAFYDAKQQLGFQDPMVWTSNSVQRVAPLSWFILTLVVLWYVKKGVTFKQASRERPWYTQKNTPTFADMLGTCRLHHWKYFFSIQSPNIPLCSKKIAWMNNYVATATF